MPQSPPSPHPDIFSPLRSITHSLAPGTPLLYHTYTSTHYTRARVPQICTSPPTLTYHTLCSTSNSPTGMHSSPSRVRLLSALLTMSMLPRGTYGHGAVTFPRPRNAIDGVLAPWNETLPTPLPFDGYCPIPAKDGKPGVWHECPWPTLQYPCSAVHRSVCCGVQHVCTC